MNGHPVLAPPPRIGGRHLDELLAMAVTLIVGAKDALAVVERKGPARLFPGCLFPVFDERLAPAGGAMPLCWCGLSHAAPIPYKRQRKLAEKWERSGWLDGSGNRAEHSALTAIAPRAFMAVLLEEAPELATIAAEDAVLVEAYLLRFR